MRLTHSSYIVKKMRLLSWLPRSSYTVANLSVLGFRIYTTYETKICKIMWQLFRL